MPASFSLIVLIALVFTLEGAIIGKVIPTTAVFPAMVVWFGSDPFTIILLVHLAATAATVGQYLIFITSRESDSPGASYDFINKYVYESKAYSYAMKYFKKVTPNTVLITNALPAVRGMMIIPLSTTDHSDRKMLGAAYIGNALHFGGATLVFVGSLSILPF